MKEFDKEIVAKVLENRFHHAYRDVLNWLIEAEAFIEEYELLLKVENEEPSA